VVLDIQREYDVPYLLRVDDLPDLKKFLSENYSAQNFAIAWTPDSTKELPAFLDLVYETGNLWVVFEEVNLKGLGNLWSPDSTFIDIVNFGRNRGISMICVAKRPAQVTRDLTSQADVIISFRQDEPRDIQYLKDFCGPGVEDVVAKLQGHKWAVIYPAIDEKGD
jgi:hypothetical protein